MAATMGLPAARIFWKVAWPLRQTVGGLVWGIMCVRWATVGTVDDEASSTSNIGQYTHTYIRICVCT